MTAEQFLNNELDGGFQVYDETGVVLISGIEHSEVCRIMESYRQQKLKELLEDEIKSWEDALSITNSQSVKEIIRSKIVCLEELLFNHLKKELEK